MCQESECYLVEAGYWINKTKNVFTRNKFLPYRLLKSVVLERDNKGIFYTAYRYNIQNQDEAYLFGDMYFDFDDKKNFENVREDALKTLSYLKIVFKIQPDEVKIYFSGNKGVHVMIPTQILGIEPHKHLNQVFRFLAENVRKYTTHKTLDLVIYDNKRLFRIPASIHESTGLYKVPITFNELQNLSHDDIKALAGQPRYFDYPEPKSNPFAINRYKELVKRHKEESTKRVSIQHKKKLSCTPPCVKYLLDNGASDGNRNNSIAAIASFHKNSGIEMNNAMELIKEWNDTYNSPPTKHIELEKTVKSIYYGNASYGCNTLKILSECNEKECPLKKKGGKTYVRSPRRTVQ